MHGCSSVPFAGVYGTIRVPVRHPPSGLCPPCRAPSFGFVLHAGFALWLQASNVSPPGIFQAGRNRLHCPFCARLHAPRVWSLAFEAFEFVPHPVLHGCGVSSLHTAFAMDRNGDDFYIYSGELNRRECALDRWLLFDTAWFLLVSSFFLPACCMMMLPLLPPCHGQHQRVSALLHIYLAEPHSLLCSSAGYDQWGAMFRYRISTNQW